MSSNGKGSATGTNRGRGTVSTLDHPLATTSDSSNKTVASLVQKKEDVTEEAQAFLSEIFGQPTQDTASASTAGKPLGFHNLSQHLDARLEEAARKTFQETECQFPEDNHGRLGPDTVLFETSGNSGTMIIEADRYGIISHSNFSTIRGNCCVFKGKWVFELMLGSKGVMQLGWCTLDCKFSQEEGVGDTDNSYAYDGNRIRKWNMKTPQKYGRMWLAGDVISCAIDCDIGTISFARNGSSMGEAFTNIRLGPGIAYFPAVSLSLSEHIRVNFGATPLRYPIKGHSPLQRPPLQDLGKTRQLFIYLDRVIPQLAPDSVENEVPKDSTVLEVGTAKESVLKPRSLKATLLLLSAHIFDKLAVFLKNPYIVESCLLKCLLENCDVDSSNPQTRVHQILDLLWGLLQEPELKQCLEHLMSSLQSSYRYTPVSAKFTCQRQYLTLTLAILRHEDTRKYLLKNILFDKIKFVIFMHTKPPDDDLLLELIPEVWWGFPSQEEEEEENLERPEQAIPPEEQERKNRYYASCQALQEKVYELEKLQVDMIKMLLTNTDDDQGETASSRFVFLYKLREFLKEHAVLSMRSHLANFCPLSVLLCFFHRLVRALRETWDDFNTLHPDDSVPSTGAFVPYQKFYDETVNYFDIQRLGGLMSHLKKSYKEDIARDRRSVCSDDQPLPHYREITVRNEELVDEQRKMYADEPLGRHMASAHSLVEILDGLVMLYSIAVHRQLGKMCTLRDMVHEYVTALEDVNKKLKNCPQELDKVREELLAARDVFEEKVAEQARHMSWVIAVIYSKEKQEDVFWLLRVTLRTLELASEQNKLFSFVPDYYVDTCISAYNALKGYFHPTRRYMDLPDFSLSLHDYAKFLCSHFSDPRIVNADVKDNLVQALACFVCYPVSLRALESVAAEHRLHMCKSLLAPYEHRSWAPTNWILVRLWKGCGFGYRYKHLPHLLPAKNQQQEIGNASLQKPCPSPLFQQHLAAILRQDEESATRLIDTLLNQLNWAFSEFIGMLQELQQLASRPTAAFIDSRQLKICATCFDISIGLLRVLEMITRLTPELLTDWSKPSAELLLCRLFQLLTQMLNRVTTRSNTFDMVVTAGMPGLETVDHFPILTAITGILLALVMNSDTKGRERATAALLAEPGFQIFGLDFLLGGSGMEATAAPPASKQVFSFKNYKEVNGEEIKQVEQLISHLQIQKNKSQTEAPVVDEETECNICYAKPKSVVFMPCGHQSCRKCIAHHLMSRKECFFCKVKIESLADLSTGDPVPMS